MLPIIISYNYSLYNIVLPHIVLLPSIYKCYLVFIDCIHIVFLDSMLTKNIL